FVETSPSGTVCNPSVAPCIGGFARLATVVRQSLEREPDSLLLNGGDSFQGTIWYNLLRWNVTQDFMNMLPHDAHVLGNHEFDNGIEGVVPYLKALNSTVVTANIIDDDEPTIQGLYKPSVIVERGERKIGIIGVIIATTDQLASTGDLKFTNEVETVRREAEKLNAQRVNIIIVLSHCGIDTDREIAQHAGPYVDIIVGGHSHTLLYNGEPPEESGFTPRGPYPVVVELETRSVLIVQAAAHTQYLGEIKLFFDDAGNLLSWGGHPHYIGNEIEQAEDVLEKINQYLPEIEELASREVGSSLVHLSSDCACQECNLGSFICDAFMHAAMNKSQGDNWSYAHFCIMNQGGVRTSMNPGVITVETVLLSTPFENNVEVFELRGDHIVEMLEFSVMNEPFNGARMLQIAGLRPIFDGSRPVSQRVVSVSVRCIECDIPRYEPLQLDKYYKVVSQSFLGNGGDGFSVSWLYRMRYSVLFVFYSTWLVFLDCFFLFVTVLVYWTLICASDLELLKMTTYTNEEYADMLICYGYCNCVSLRARNEYITRYPGRRVPDISVFEGVYRRLRETGSVLRRRTDLGRPRVNDDDEEQDNEIVRRFRRDPTTSTNIIARELGLSQWKVWHTVHTAGLYPYHYTPVHHIEEGDPVRRLDFCRFMLHADLDDPEFLRRILWTDESKFDQDGITNYHNLHYWSPKAQLNPNKKQVKGSQRRFSLNVWMGIVSNYLIGPFFLPERLYGETYENFLRQDLSDLLDDIPLDLIRDMWFQHDGCPAHYRRSVREWLDTNYPNKWIGRGGPTPWPARSPDLTPMDFYVWGHMKSLVYNDTNPIISVDVLRQKIIDAANEIRRILTTSVVKSGLRHRMR
ncbi:apyrase-like, partial [Hyposmocoma kahamanoa]|uniref:apyrase-like n=1 Tax=Hyposmocoma kahamanoa TaxID=1477025 RepID=UPI000E6D9EC5